MLMYCPNGGKDLKWTSLNICVVINSQQFKVTDQGVEHVVSTGKSRIYSHYEMAVSGMTGIPLCGQGLPLFTMNNGYSFQAIAQDLVIIGYEFFEEERHTVVTSPDVV